MNTLIRKTALGMALALAGASAGAVTTGNPTALNVTLYKTEIYNGSSWATVMDNATGVQVDLLGSLGGAFGSGNVDIGTYTKVRFTLKNQISYNSAAITGTDNCGVATNQTMLIDTGALATAQTPLVFGTNGGVGWRANGTETYPYLMTKPVVVGENATTDVKLAFKTANMVTCTGSTLGLTPPSFDVISVLKATSATFTGGDYWVVGLRKHMNSTLYNNGAVIAPAMVTPTGATLAVPLYDYLLNSTATSETIGGTTYGPYTDGFNATGVNGVAITVGEYYRAQLRSYATSELAWGMKMRITPSATDPTVGTVSMVRDQGKHRHMLDDSNSTTSGATAAPNADLGAPILFGNYTLDANNRITIIASDGSVIKGAFDPSYEVMTAANVSQPNGSTELNVVIKVQTTGTNGPLMSVATNGSALYSWLNYDTEFERYTPAGAVTPWVAKQAVRAWYAAGIGMFKLTDTAGVLSMAQTNFYNRSRMDNPLSMDQCDMSMGAVCGANPYWSKAEPSNEYSTMTVTSAALTPTPGATGDIGAGLLSTMDPSNPPWVASAPTVGITAVASGTADTDSRFTSTTLERHYLGYALIMQQATAGTHTTASVAGTYMVNYMWDDLQSGRVLNGGGYGELTFDGAGGLGATVYEKAADGSVTPHTLTASYTVTSICIGVNANVKEVAALLNNAGTVYPQTLTDGVTVVADANAARTLRDDTNNRLSPTDATCTGGNKLDLILGYDPAVGTVFATGNPKLALMLNKDAKVVSFIDPQSLGNSNHRQLGIGVKLK
ncbi:MAG: hypothetical protein OEW08_05525 [Gammaproteobacteria bacterium]|nr:hypothetical protein [Gammaproteobacteria bacterium]